MELPLDVWNNIASLDVEVYRVLILCIADFYRQNKGKQQWWMDHFGIIKYAGIELPGWVFVSKWRPECQNLPDPEECVEYYWSKGGYGHRIGGPAQICTATMNNKEVWKCRAWVRDGTIIKRNGFAKTTLRYSPEGKLFCYVGHGGWHLDYDLDEHLVYAKKHKEDGKWSYTIAWKLGSKYITSKDNHWYQSNPIGHHYLTTEFNKISNLFGWKEYFSLKKITTKAIYKRLMFE